MLPTIWPLTMVAPLEAGFPMSRSGTGAAPPGPAARGEGVVAWGLAPPKRDLRRERGEGRSWEGSRQAA